MILFQFGAIAITLWIAIIGFIILVITLFFASRTKRYLDEHFKQFRHIMDIDVQRYRFFIHFIWGLVVIVGIGFVIYLIPGLRSIGISIFAGASVLAVIVGFAAQQALSNVMSGLFIAIFKPYRVGDWVRVGEDYGKVEDITLRHTVIKNPQNKRVIIPNSIIGDERIENWSIDDRRICQWVEQSISYDANVDLALAIMQEESQKHPLFIDPRTAKEKEEDVPSVSVRVVGFGDSSVRLRAWVWTPDPMSALQLGWDLNKSIKQRFDKEGIEIPFPYRTIVYKKDMAAKKKKKRK